MENKNNTQEQISREDYLIALEVVDNYHRQKDSMEIEISSNRIKLSSFVNSMETEHYINGNTNSVHTRLMGELISNREILPEYLEEVNVVELSKWGNLGAKSVQLFVQLRRDYIKNNK